MIQDFISDLNIQQKAAVEYNDGPSLIIAGAGSGKTRVLTCKIAYLMQMGIPPYRLLALTFTNKAAKEMKQRIAQLVDESSARQLWMGTFHSVFSRILRTEAQHIGFQATFTIFDSADSRNLIKTIIKQMQLDEKIYKPAKIQSAISNAKNALVSASMYAQNKEMCEYDQRAKVPLIKDIYKEYTLRLKSANAMDFDDLLFYTNRLFRDNPEILKKYQERFGFILVDEYQDTNFAQYLVIKQLAEAHHKVCVVGDDAQSIYSFRGANIDNILNFSNVYPEARTFKLEQNYRSTQTIVNAANSLIKQNKDQIQKNIFSENGTGEQIELISAYSDFEEGIIVANQLLDLRRHMSSSYSDFVILYRTNAQSRIFEESLRKRNIPYRIYGGLSFYQRKEIKDLIAYFRLTINPYDEEAFKRIINYPARGIGNTTLLKISETASRHQVSLWEIIRSPLQYNLEVNAGTAKKLTGFFQLIDSFISKLNSSSAYELATTIAKQSGVMTDAYSDMTPEGMSRQENIQELLSAIHTFCEIRQEEDNPKIGMTDFLSEVSLLSDQDTDKEADKDKVTMMTIHAAKGLEFDNVFIVGLEEDLFPSAMAKNEFRGMEEERRLFYVAITRARKNCILTYAKSRFKNGTINPCNVSSFIRDIDSSFLHIHPGALDERFSGTYPGHFGNTAEKHNIDRPNANFYEKEKIQSINKTLPGFIAVDKASPKENAGAFKDTIQVGNTIKHERFGIGKIIEINGEANSRKATVEFENSGTKQLLLKFARFEIIQNK